VDRDGEVHQLEERVVALDGARAARAAKVAQRCGALAVGCLELRVVGGVGATQRGEVRDPARVAAALTEDDALLRAQVSEARLVLRARDPRRHSRVAVSSGASPPE
jgi:hypothetical protein